MYIFHSISCIFESAVIIEEKPMDQFFYSVHKVGAVYFPIRVSLKTAKIDPRILAFKSISKKVFEIFFTKYPILFVNNVHIYISFRSTESFNIFSTNFEVCFFQSNISIYRE